MRAAGDNSIDPGRRPPAGPDPGPAAIAVPPFFPPGEYRGGAGEITGSETAITGSTAARMREFQAQRNAMEAAQYSPPADPAIVAKQRELGRTLREAARARFFYSEERPEEVLAEIRFINGEYAHALDPADLPALVHDELGRARKTRLPVTPFRRHQHHYTEVGLAERFVDEHWESVLYCAGMKAWLVWNGRVWEKDTADAIRTKAKRTARGLYTEVERIEDEGAKRVLLAFARQAESARGIKAMLELARSELPIQAEDLDADPDLFNVRNGTVDLATGAFREHRPEDYLTRMADVEYVAGARCPAWEAHLDRVFAGDAAAIAGFRRMCGYSLLAENPAEVFFILHGTGANGKSKTLEVLSTIWGEYSRNVDASRTLLARKYHDGPRTELAALVGARLVTTSEGAEGARLDEGVVKQLTGRDRITVRRLYEAEFEYRPGYKIWYATNHRPPVSADPSIWRRIWLVPFTVTIPPGERDEGIAAKLLAERSGILNWCLDGLREYIDAGRKLVPPEAFAAATEEYRSEADVVQRFLDDECVITGDRGDFIPRREGYAAFVSWARDNGEPVLSTRKFAAKLRDTGVFIDPKVAHVHDESGKRVSLRYYRGIRFRYLGEPVPAW